MSQIIHPLAGQPAPVSILIDVGALLGAYEDIRPDPSDPGQRVDFGTSGHRGTSGNGSFNEWHILAITQAICDYRRAHGIAGPLFLGIDTHALSAPAAKTALGVLAANAVDVMIAADDEFTPTPVISHAILTHNRTSRGRGLADGIVMTPSHNPPRDGGYKYNPPHGGPADANVTSWIGKRANEYLEKNLGGVRRLPHEQARNALTTHEHDYLSAYVADLDQVVRMDVIRTSGIRLGVDPLGGAGVNYWGAIADHYGIDLTVCSHEVDPQFAFMSVDWDGQIRMDPSSAHAMQRLIGQKDSFHVSFACDTDHDRHGIISAGKGLLSTNHYVSVLADWLFAHREGWPGTASLGKSAVTTSMLDRVAARAGRRIYETPVGFKWFAQGLHDGRIALACEESAGAALLRRDGQPWATDKDGIVASLLAGEITGASSRTPDEHYRRLENDLGEMFSTRIEAAASLAQKQVLKTLDPADILLKDLAGDRVKAILSRAPGNDEPIGGIKIVSEGGWFAARPSGTEDIYKIYAESFRGEDHLRDLLNEAQQIVDLALKESDPS